MREGLTDAERNKLLEALEDTLDEIKKALVRYLDAELEKRVEKLRRPQPRRG